MIAGDFYIDGKSAYETYGVTLKQGALGEVVCPPMFKSLDKTDWPEEDGEEVDLSNPILDTRELELELNYTSAEGARKLIEHLKQPFVFNMIDNGYDFSVNKLWGTRGEGNTFKVVDVDGVPCLYHKWAGNNQAGGYNPSILQGTQHHSTGSLTNGVAYPVKAGATYTARIRMRVKNNGSATFASSGNYYPRMLVWLRDAPLEKLTGLVSDGTDAWPSSGKQITYLGWYHSTDNGATWSGEIGNVEDTGWIDVVSVFRFNSSKAYNYVTPWMTNMYSAGFKTGMEHWIMHFMLVEGAYYPSGGNLPPYAPSINEPTLWNYHSVFRFPELGDKEYKFRFKGNSDYSVLVNMGELKLDLQEDIPSIAEGTMPTAPTATTKGYVLDGIDLTEYNIYTLQGTDESLLEAGDLKNNLEIDKSNVAGVVYYQANGTKMEERSISLNLLLIENTQAEFWSSWNAFLTAVTAPEERVFEALGRRYYCYYDSVDIETFDVLRGSKVWCAFTLELNVRTTEFI